MAVASNEEGKKWIQASVAGVCILLGYVLISFFDKMSDWFPVESVIPYYFGIARAVGVLIGLVTYIYIMRTPKTADFLGNVYQELVKVVWPDSQQTWRHTVVIMIAVTIMGFVFGLFDFSANFLLNLVNK
jgi:preprotein translocase subunit SecE